MKVYLAAAFQEQDYMRRVRYVLERHGITVTSRWLDVEYKDHNDLSWEEKEKWAINDFSDVDKADVFVLYNPDKWHKKGTGGRHVETGYAIARSKMIVYIGNTRENLFHWHPLVKAHITEDVRVASLSDLLVDTLVLLVGVRRVSDR